MDLDPFLSARCAGRGAQVLSLRLLRDPLPRGAGNSDSDCYQFNRATMSDCYCSQFRGFAWSDGTPSLKAIYPDCEALIQDGARRGLRRALKALIADSLARPCLGFSLMLV